MNNRLVSIFDYVSKSLMMALLQAQLDTHVKSFKCDYGGCGKLFKRKHQLTTHKRTHTNEKPYICDFDGCDAAFADSSTLTMRCNICTVK